MNLKIASRYMKTLTLVLFSFVILSVSAQKKYKFEITPISPNEYKSLSDKYLKKQAKPFEIDSLNQVVSILKGIVVFDEFGAVKSIKPTKGDKIEFDEYDRPFFLSYFPDENILYLEGGHSSDISYDLTTGEGTELVGIPFYELNSPNNKFRLTGYWSGQECSFYFIQENKGGRFQKIGDIIQDDLCNMYDHFWSDDNTLYYRFANYQGEATNLDDVLTPISNESYRLRIVEE